MFIQIACSKSVAFNFNNDISRSNCRTNCTADSYILNRDNRVSKQVLDIDNYFSFIHPLNINSSMIPAVDFCCDAACKCICACSFDSILCPILLVCRKCLSRCEQLTTVFLPFSFCNCIVCTSRDISCGSDITGLAGKRRLNAIDFNCVNFGSSCIGRHQ